MHSDDDTGALHLETQRLPPNPQGKTHMAAVLDSPQARAASVVPSRNHNRRDKARHIHGDRGRSNRHTLRHNSWADIP